MMAWYKTLRKSVQGKYGSRAAIDYLSEDAYGSSKNSSHQYTPADRRGTKHQEKAIMGYEDTVRPARRLEVEAAPVFIDSLNDKLFMTDYSKSIRIYKTNGKQLDSVHTESTESILSGLAVDKSGKNLYVRDAHAHKQARVQIFSLGEHINPVVYLGKKNTFFRCS